MANEGIGGMITTSRLIYAAEREEGKIEGKQSALAKLIGLRFPSASSSFIKKVSKPISDSYVDELMTVVLATSTLDEFKKKVKTLKTACL